MNNLYKLGDVVTLKSHPLLDEFLVQGDDRYVPPFMVVIEVFFETKKKKICDEATGKKVADNIKYKCIYFNDNKSEFNELTVYQSMLSGIDDIKIYSISSSDDNQDYKKLIDEVKDYKIPEYIYAKKVNFKTIKLEIYKKRKSTQTIEEHSAKALVEKTKKVKFVNVVSFASPVFLISGYKKEKQENLFYHDGNPRLICSEEFYKVQWFNPFQQKFSEQFVPKECLADNSEVFLKVKASKVNNS